MDPLRGIVVMLSIGSTISVHVSKNQNSVSFEYCYGMGFDNVMTDMYMIVHVFGYKIVNFDG